MSEYEGILDSLEELHRKLDRLLGWNVPLEASGGDWSTKEHMKIDLKNAKKIIQMTDQEFRCGHCGIIFLPYHDGTGINTGMCPKCFNEWNTVGLDEKLPVETTTNFALPKTGEYQWYRLKDHEGKVRACNNDGCDLFLLFNKDKKKYEHWKFDPNTGKGGYVQDNCDYYGGF